MPIYNVKFYEQLVDADNLEDLVDKVQKHKDAVAFTIIQDGFEVAAFRKYRGLERYPTEGGESHVS